jgi:hypothetical protein
MKKWEEAEKDANKALEMDPKNAKVFSQDIYCNPNKYGLGVNYF